MKKIAILCAFVLLVGLCSTGCANNNQSEENSNNQQSGSDDNTLSVLWDSSVFLMGFNDVEVAVAEKRKQMANEDQESIDSGEKLIENTQIINDWVEQKGYKLESLSWGWADQLTSKLNAAFLAKSGPDVIVGETQMPQYAKAGNLEPFPDDLADYIRENCSYAAYADMEFDGKIYGVCLTPSICVLTWNKDILSQTKSYGKGTSVYENGPKDWEEWLEVMKEVSALSNKQLYAGGAYCGGNNGGYLRVGALMRGAGGDYADKNMTPNINTKENVAAFEFVRQMYKYTVAGVLNAPQESEFNTAFDRGNLAYKVDGMWSVKGAESLDFECGYSLVPGKEEGDVSNMLIGAAYLSVPTYSNNKEVAFELIKRCLEDDIQQNIADIGLRAPVLKSVIESDEYKASNPQMYEFANYMLNNKVQGLPSFSGNLSDLWTSVGEALSSTLTTTKDVGDILSATQISMEKANQSN